MGKKEMPSIGPSYTIRHACTGAFWGVGIDARADKDHLLDRFGVPQRKLSSDLAAERVREQYRRARRDGREKCGQSIRELRDIQSIRRLFAPAEAGEVRDIHRVIRREKLRDWCHVPAGDDKPVYADDRRIFCP